MSGTGFNEYDGDFTEKTDKQYNDKTYYERSVTSGGTTTKYCIWWHSLTSGSEKWVGSKCDDIDTLKAAAIAGGAVGNNIQIQSASDSLIRTGKCPHDNDELTGKWEKWDSTISTPAFVATAAITVECVKGLWKIITNIIFLSLSFRVSG